MNRSKYPVSVVPYPIDRTGNTRGKSIDENTAWDSKWLRPSVPVVAREKIETKAVEAEEEVHVSLPLRVLR